NLREPRPLEGKDEQTFELIQLCLSLAVGFPHIAGGIWRNWGRNTFISLRGLILLTHRYEQARYLILSYDRCLLANGYEILFDKVSRLYLTHDSSSEMPGTHDQLL
ncbi:unnamed protein product, partial [Rotaria sp. Silwood2]